MRAWYGWIIAAVVLVSASASRASLITFEDFANAPAGSYTTYSGNTLGAVAEQTGWSIGGRYYIVNDLGGGVHDIVGQQSNGGLSIATALTLVTNEYIPSYDVSKAISLANWSMIYFTVSNKNADAGAFNSGGSPPVLVNLKLYFYDTSAAATTSVTVGNFGYFNANQTKTVSFDPAAIAGFDQANDLVYGFRVAQTFAYLSNGHSGGITIESIQYDAVPEPATLAFLAVGGLALGAPVLRRRRR